MTANDLILQSMHIITEYYNNNLQPFFDSLSDDMLWIGPADGQEIRGRENVISTFSAEVHVLTFTIGSIRAVCVAPHKSVREIVLKYEIYTHYPDGHTDLHNQRLHYSWYKKRPLSKNCSDPRWEIAVLHISNAWTYDKRDTIYPVHYKSLGLPVRLVEKPEHYLTVTADDMSVHRIPIDHLLYIETIKRTAKLRIHTHTDTITVNGSLSEFEHTYAAFLLRIHAAFLINPACVSRIERFAVTLSDGTKLPIPEKKYTAVKRILLAQQIHTT